MIIKYKCFNAGLQQMEMTNVVLMCFLVMCSAMFGKYKHENIHIKFIKD